jgi:hypothetical protein
MANQSPFLVDQLAFYQTHNAKLMELQAARGKSAVDPSSFMPSSSMYDELIGAFTTEKLGSVVGSKTPTSSTASASSVHYTGSSSSVSPSNSSSQSLLDTSGNSDDLGIALRSALSNNPGAIAGGLASLAIGNLPGVLKSLFGIGADAVSGYTAIQALRTPAQGENAGQTPTADLAAMAALGDTGAEAASNYDNRIQQASQPTFTPVVYSGSYNPNGAAGQRYPGEVSGYKNSVTGEITTSKPSIGSSSESNPYDDYFSNSSNPYSGYTTYGTSEGE